MESFYSKSQYKSVDFILNSYSSEMFDGITVLMRPVVGGMDYLRSVHQAYKFQKEISKLLRAISPERLWLSRLAFEKVL